MKASTGIVHGLAGVLITLTSSASQAACNVALPNLFSPYVAIPTGSWPEAVAIGDVNGDGRNDVVLTTSYYFDPDNDYRLFVFLQDQAGQLSPPVKYLTSGSYTARPTSVDIGDVNHDGRADVVIGHDRKSIQVFLQNADGQLVDSADYPTSHSTRIRLGDLNNDGWTDVAGIGWGGDYAGVFLQQGNGTLDVAQAYPAPHGGYDDIEVGDVNNDGLSDIVVMSGQLYAKDNLGVLTQTAGGFDPVVPYDIGGNELTRGVSIGDLNGDGLNDVVTSYGGNQPNSNIAVFEQEAGGTLGLPFIHPSYDIPEAIQVADVNLDGRDDLVVLHGGWLKMGVYAQTADGQIANETLFTLPYASHYKPDGLAVGDINSDGSPDVVVADYNNGLVVLANTLSALLVADAGANQKVLPRTYVTLDGTGSHDCDDTIVSYVWRQVKGPAVKLHKVDGSPGVVTFKSTALGTTPSAKLVFKLIVKNDAGEKAVDWVAVNVVKRM